MTEAELLEAIRAATQITPDNPDGFITTDDIVSASGMSYYSVRKTLKSLLKQNRLEVQQLQRKNIAGIYQRVPGYKVLESSF